MKPYYEEAGIAIYHGDCLEILPDLGPVDLYLTDPPYQFENSGGGFYGAWEGRNQGSHDPRTYLNELRDLNCVDCKPSSFLPLFGESAAVIFCNKALIAEYLQFAAWKRFLYDVHVLSKTNPIPVKSNHFIHDLEYIVLFRKKQSYFDDSGPMRMYRKMFQVSCGGNVNHPAEKPVALLAKYAWIMCPATGTICDPFMGSGSSLIAARSEGRVAIGIESEERYCEIAVNRLRQSVLDFGPVNKPEEFMAQLGAADEIAEEVLEMFAEPPAGS